MDPTDDDLFADLYGDSEPQAEPTAEKPLVSAASSGQLQQAAPASPVQASSTALPAPASRAVDPRQPPQTIDRPSQDWKNGENVVPAEANHNTNRSQDHGWDAAAAAHGQHGHHSHHSQDNHAFENTSGVNGFAEQGSGSPAIKEDGKMFIGGLNWETTDESLKDYFSQFGEVTECTVMRDGPTGRSRGFGFLTFKDPKTVNIVMVKEHYLDGKIVIDPKRAIPRDEQEKTSKIFVGGVSQEATEADFREYFTQFGRVLDATLMMDKDTGRPRGFGFVTFDSEAAVENALSYPNLEILGKAIEVKKAQPRGKNFDDRDDRFRDRGHHNRGDQQRDHNGNQPNQSAQSGQTNNAYNGLTPQMMAQYWQNMQRYMQAMTQFGRGGSVQVPAVNPAVVQQAIQTMGVMAGQGMMGMNPQMMAQMNMQQQQQQQQQPQMMRMQPQQQPPPASQSPPATSPQGSPGPGAYSNPTQQPYPMQHAGYDQQTSGYNQRFQNHPSQRDYQPPQQHPSSWEGMYDDVPPQQVVQQVQNQQRTGTSTAYNRFDGPPPNAPTGPKNSRPGSNYRGGRGGIGGGRHGSGGGFRGGFHPYQRSGERFS